MAQEYISWENDVDDVVTTTNYGIQKLVMNEKFGFRWSEIIKHFSFVVLDEAHSICADATFSESAFHVNAFIDYINEEYPAIKVILMTGTPEPINWMIKGKIPVIDVMERCKNVVPKSIRYIERKEAIGLMAMLNNEKTIYYSNSAKGLIKGNGSLYNKLQELGVEAGKIAVCMNEDRAKEYSTGTINWVEKCAKAKKEIVTTHKMPKGKTILLTTSTLKEGVNIDDESIKVAFGESHLLSDIQQFAGRVRTTLDVLYIIVDAKQHNITESKYKKYLLELLYANKEVIAGANRFLSKYIMNSESQLYKLADYETTGVDWYEFVKEDYSLYSIGGETAKFFVDYVQDKNQYVKFNHLKGMFENYKCRIVEQKRVYTNFSDYTWKKNIDEFCKLYGTEYFPIEYAEFVEVEEIISMLEPLVGKKIFGEEKEMFKNYMAYLFIRRLTPQVKTMNNDLKAFKIPYEIKSGTTKHKGKNVRFLTVERKEC